MKNCFICNRIDLIKKGENKFFVKELKSGYVVFADHQLYLGYTIFLSKIHTDELHKLKLEDKTQFLKDMSVVAEAVYKAFKPKKLNYELLGNTDPHLHWHIIPRYKNDPKPNVPVWVIPSSIRSSKTTIPSESEIEVLKKKLIFEIDRIIKIRFQDLNS